MYGGQASLGRACADLFQQARLNTDCKINFPGWVGVVGKAENIATQPSLAGAWAELGNIHRYIGKQGLGSSVLDYNFTSAKKEGQGIDNHFSRLSKMQTRTLLGEVSLKQAGAELC